MTVDLITTVALGVIALSAVAHTALALVALWAALRKRPLPAIGQALCAAFGVLVVGVGLLAVSLEFTPARLIGAIVVLTGLVLLALSRRVGVRPVQPRG